MYVGDFKDNCLTGSGHILYGNGTSYTGGFMKNLRQGAGEIAVSDSVRQVGPFVDDERHGVMTELRSVKMCDGIKGDESQEGLWRHGTFQEVGDPASAP